VIVKVTGTVDPPPARAVRGIVALNVPFPANPPVKVAVPVTTKAVDDVDTVPLIVMVVLSVAACAATQTNRPARTRNMFLLPVDALESGLGPSE
jgi:hypothetical protein